MDKQLCSAGEKKAAIEGSPSPLSNVILPYDMEREIFEMTALLYPRVMVKLPMVAKRVKAWVEPIMYRTITLNHSHSGPKFLRVLRNSSKPPEFFATHVKSLCLSKGVSVPEARVILEQCVGVRTLACWIEPNAYAAGVLMPIIREKLTHLQRLSVNFSHLRLLLSGGGDGNVLLEHVSHLDMSHPWALYQLANVGRVGGGGAVDIGFEALPQLTHLSFRFWARDPEGAGPILKRILELCPNLEVLALLVDPNENASLDRGKVLHAAGLQEDRRIVLVENRGDSMEEIWNAVELAAAAAASVKGAP
ncbi:hypothetical protein Moror_16838 [Moniliophthora roreri MCA 2997]|uniref:F-box domain-containing protein n=2 Tax=Moniliophthora roreri TaxID=221103 RepID=V2XAF1_MONRO|nr:hypothetical protein Moror_16838 [Moniliophthora roreri MCA 2997]